MPFVTTCRDVIRPQDCDHLGHLNLSGYYRLVGDGMFTIQAHLGFTPDDVRGGRRLSFAAVHTEAKFFREILPGEIVRLDTGILRLGRKSVTCRHNLILFDETLAFQADITGAVMDLKTRTAVPLPEAARAAAEAFLVTDEIAPSD